MCDLSQYKYSVLYPSHKIFTIYSVNILKVPVVLALFPKLSHRSMLDLESL